MQRLGQAKSMELSIFVDAKKLSIVEAERPSNHTFFSATLEIVVQLPVLIIKPITICSSLDLKNWNAL